MPPNVWGCCKCSPSAQEQRALSPSQDKLHFLPVAHWREQILFILWLKGGGFALVFSPHLVLFMASFHSADFSINRGKVLMTTALPSTESFWVFSPGGAAVGQCRVSTAASAPGTWTNPAASSPQILHLMLSPSHSICTQTPSGSVVGVEAPLALGSKCKCCSWGLC